MCNHKEAANTVLDLLEEEFKFSKDERVEALILALQILSDEELHEELE